MKTKLAFISIPLIFLSSCSGFNAAAIKTNKNGKNQLGYKAPNKTVNKNRIWARITFYHAYEDKWGAKVAASPNIRNKAGIGVAAHPDFAFYTDIRIPVLEGKLDGDDKFKIIDRGSAVTKKIASKGGEYVFDVFAPKSRFKELQRTTPLYSWVYIDSKPNL